MTTIVKTIENNAKVKALKKIAETKWTGTTIHTNLDACLTALNLDSTNSGWYKPTASRIDGLTGIFMINQDGSIFCEARVIKESEKEYKIEYMTMAGWNEFEKSLSLEDKTNLESILKKANIKADCGLDTNTMLTKNEKIWTSNFVWQAILWGFC